MKSTETASPKTRLSVALLLSLCSIAFGLFAVEFGLGVLERIALYNDAKQGGAATEYAVAARKAGRPADMRTRFRLIEELHEHGNPVVAPINFMVSNDADMKAINTSGLVPLSGISNQETIYCNELGTFSRYRSDEHGFNNPAGLYRLGALDIAAVGDSFTHGACVGADENFIAHIRKKFPKTLNFGWLANGPLLELATLREYVRPFHPRVVLWFFVENDLVDLNDEKKLPLLRKYLDRGFSQTLLGRQAEIDRVLSRYFETKMEQQSARLRQLKPDLDLRGLFADTLRLAQTRKRVHRMKIEVTKGERHEGAERDFALFKKVLEAANEEVMSWGGTFYFVYVSGWEYLANRDDKDFVSRYGIPNTDRAKVLSIAEAAGAKIIDLYPEFASQPDPLAYFPFKMFAHYAPEGYALGAKAIINRLSRDLPSLSYGSGSSVH